MQIVANEGSGLAADADAVSGAQFPVLVPKVLIDRTRTGALIDLLRIKLGFPPEVFARAAYPVIEGYAGFVQLLPAPESRHHARPGGRFSYGLEVALRALDHRRGQILPRGAAPEVIGAHAHRWTYAVFVAALLYGMGNTATGLRILTRVRGRDPRPWEPLAGSMLAEGASSYRVEIVEGDAVRDDRHRALSGRLFEECVPELVRAWLAEDATLMPELLRWLSVDGSGPHGAIAELVLRAATGARDRCCRTETPGQVSSTALSAHVEQGEDAAAEDVETEYLEDALEDAPKREPPPARAPAPDTAGPEAQVGGHPVSSRPAPAARAGATEVARSFIGWLKQGISDGTIRVNERGALVHGVNEGMLLVSPRIFREFAKQLGKHEHEGRGGAPGDGSEAAKWVQRQVLRAGWHVQAEGGINMVAYQVMREDRAVSRLSGVVIRNPAQFVDPAPPINPVLVRSPEPQERA